MYVHTRTRVGPRTFFGCDPINRTLDNTQTHTLANQLTYVRGGRLYTWSTSCKKTADHNGRLTSPSCRHSAHRSRWCGYCQRWAITDIRVITLPKSTGAIAEHRQRRAPECQGQSSGKNNHSHLPPPTKHAIAQKITCTPTQARKSCAFVPKVTHDCMCVCTERKTAETPARGKLAVRCAVSTSRFLAVPLGGITLSERSGFGVAHVSASGAQTQRRRRRRRVEYNYNTFYSESSCRELSHVE